MANGRLNNNGQYNIRQLDPETNASRTRRSRPKSSSSGQTSRQQRGRKETSHRQWSGSDQPSNQWRSPTPTSGRTTTHQQDFTSPQKRSRHIRHTKLGLYDDETPSKPIQSYREQQVATDITSPSSRSSHSFKEEKKDEGIHCFPYRFREEEQRAAQSTSKRSRRNNERRDERETNDSGMSIEEIYKKTKRQEEAASGNIQSTGNRWKNFRIGWLLSGMITVLVVVGIVTYLLATRWLQKSTIVPPAMYEQTQNPSTPTTLAQNPSAFSPFTFHPSTSPTVPNLFDPPLPGDCDRVKSGDLVLGQDLLTQRNFDVILDVTIGIFANQTEAMDVLQMEIQKLLLPKLVGCTDAQRRKLWHHYRYIVGNGNIKWRPETVEENGDCFYSYRRCFNVTFSMDLFLKTTEVQYFVVVKLIEDTFGDDLGDVLQLPPSSFVAVVVRSVINQNPTFSPTTEPTFPPTPGPTFFPSLAPTFSPTTMPPTVTMHPSYAPTTPGPTFGSTLVPSSSPTRQKDRNGYFEPLGRPIRVSCAGDSLTRGTSGGNPLASSYPSQLRGMLGESFEVHNFGRNAVTALREDSLSYVDQWQFQSSLDIKPDVYLLMLGTNDSRHWEELGHRFPEDMSFIVKKVQSVSPESPPRIMLAIPPWIKTDVYGIREEILSNYVWVEIERVAREFHLQVVDMHDVTVNQADMYSYDGLHLNQKGYHAVALAWKLSIECNNNGICEVGENCETCPGDCYVNCPP